MLGYPIPVLVQALAAEHPWPHGLRRVEHEQSLDRLARGIAVNVLADGEADRLTRLTESSIVKAGLGFWTSV